MFNLDNQPQSTVSLYYDTFYWVVQFYEAPGRQGPDYETSFLLLNPVILPKVSDSVDYPDSLIVGAPDEVVWSYKSSHSTDPVTLYFFCFSYITLNFLLYFLYFLLLVYACFQLRPLKHESRLRSKLFKTNDSKFQKNKSLIFLQESIQTVQAVL